MLTAGASYTSLAKFLLGIGVMPFSSAAVYKAQRQLMPDIISFAKDVCRNNREAMEQGAVVGIDGSWDHRRNGSVHILDMIDLASGLIVDFEIVERKSKKRPGNYRGSSNGMEVEAMRRMIVRWEDDRKVRRVVTDQDAKIGKVLRESPWGVEHEFDPNHAKKSLKRFYDKLSATQRQHLYGLGDRLKTWFHTVLHLPINRAQKIELWENAYNHYRGIHTKCPDPDHHGYIWPHRNDPDALTTLNRYLEKGSEVIRQADPSRGSTQANESFHSVKAMYADKRLNFSGSCECRFALAVIAHSGGPGWLDTLRASLALDALPMPCTEQWRLTDRRRRARNEQRRRPEARRKRNAYRADLRGRRSVARAGERDYRMAAE